MGIIVKLGWMVCIGAGIYVVVNNIGVQVVPTLFGLALASIGAIGLGRRINREKAEYNSQFWPKDREYD